MTASRRALLVGATILGFHALGIVRLIGAKTLVEGKPLAQIDWAHHNENAHTARELWRDTGRIDGWSPRFMGGFPHGTADSVSNRYGELMTAVLPIDPAPRAFGWAVVLLLVLAPLGCVVAASALGPSSPAATSSVLLVAIALLWRTVDGPRPYLILGLYGYVAAIAIAPAAIALTLRCGERRSLATGLAAVALVALGWSCHLFFPLLIVPGLLIGLAAGGIAPPRLRLSRALSLTAAVGGAALALPLWLPLWRARRAIASLASPFYQDGLSALWQEVRSLWVLLWLAGAWGVLSVVRCRRATTAAEPAAGSTQGLHRSADPQRRFVAIALGTAAATLAVLGTFGGLLPATARLQPTRFLEGVGFLLAAPAALAILAAARRHRLILVPAALLLAVPLSHLVAQAVGVAEPLVAWDESDPDPRIQGDLLPLVEALRDPTLPAGRLMVEESAARPGRGMIWGDVLLPSLLPRLLDRETTARSIPDSRLVQGRIAFVDGVAFGRPVEAWTDGELRTRLARWQVAVIVAWSQAATENLSTRRFVAWSGRVGRFSLFTVRPPPTAPGSSTDPQSSRRRHSVSTPSS